VQIDELEELLVFMSSVGQCDVRQLPWHLKDDRRGAGSSGSSGSQSDDPPGAQPPPPPPPPPAKQQGKQQAKQQGKQQGKQQAKRPKRSSSSSQPPPPPPPPLPPRRVEPPQSAASQGSEGNSAMFDLWQLLGPHVHELDGGAFEAQLLAPGGPRGSAAWRLWASGYPKPQPQQTGGWKRVAPLKQPAGARPYGHAERLILAYACAAGPVDKAVGGERGGDGGSDDSAAAVDIWQLSADQRVDLAISWMRGLRRQWTEQLAASMRSCQVLNTELRQLNDSGSVEILKAARVVGCTTTGAAKFKDMLSSCSVVMVEEAGEVLEAHVLTSLSPKTKQLIMVRGRPGGTVLRHPRHIPLPLHSPFSPRPS
jgi:hypothetical protein